MRWRQCFENEMLRNETNKELHIFLVSRKCMYIFFSLPRLSSLFTWHAKVCVQSGEHKQKFQPSVEIELQHNFFSLRLATQFVCVCVAQSEFSRFCFVSHFLKCFFSLSLKKAFCWLFFIFRYLDFSMFLFPLPVLLRPSEFSFLEFFFSFPIIFLSLSLDIQTHAHTHASSGRAGEPEETFDGINVLE